MVKLLASVALVALFGATIAQLPFPGDFVPRRIVNGTDASIENIPFQVSILLMNSQWCGAVILDANTILTAAHCFDRYFDGFNPLSDYSIRAGSSFWASGGTVIGVASVTPHEYYNKNTFDFDIALFKLNSPLTLGVGVQPVVLAADGAELTAGQDIQVSGWGRLYQGGGLPSVLQKIVMPVLSRAQCEAMFANINPITNGMFCAGFLMGEGDSCNGDSGGPLVDMNNVLYGLVSWGMACASEGFTGVYTNVPYFIAWITKHRL